MMSVQTFHTRPNFMELSNDKQKVVVKSFREAKTSHMHWYAKPTIEKTRKIL